MSVRTAELEDLNPVEAGKIHSVVFSAPTNYSLFKLNKQLSDIFLFLIANAVVDADFS